MGFLLLILFALVIFVWPGLASVALIAFILFNAVQMIAECISNKMIMWSAIIFNGIPMIAGMALFIWACS